MNGNNIKLLLLMYKINKSEVSSYLIVKQQEANLKAQWKKNKNLKPQVILDKINNIKKITDGKVTFSSIEYHDAKFALESMISFPPVANDLDKHKLVSDAVWEVFKTTGAADTFIKQVNKNMKTTLAKRDNKYYLLTSVSILNPRVRSITVNECNIKFYKSNFPRKFKGRVELIDSKKQQSETESLGYTKVVIEITSKSEQIAASKALRALDLLRSVFALFANNSDEFVGNQWEPINKIRLGEFHTVHNDTGEIYPETFWYDPSYSYAKPFSSKDISIIAKNVKFIISNLDKLNRRYKLILTEGLLRYVRAFDEQNQNVAVMRSWSALESIAAPNESNCDSVTRRCAFLFDESEYHKQILEHLREYRNRNVHAGEESKKAKNHGFQIQRYFKQLILFHIRNSYFFDSIQDTNNFLDLPTNEVSLLKNKKIIDKALKFRGYVA